MAANTISTAFVEQFEREIHLAFQRQGAKLLNTIRRVTNVVGSQTTFQKMGKGVAGTKSRNGNVPILNLDHSVVVCTLADYYAGEYIDRLDLLKVNHDERNAVARTIAYAMGRKADELVTTALDAATNTTADAGAVTYAKIEEIFEAFGNNDVPDDNQRWGWVSPQGWTDMLSMVAVSGEGLIFSNADFIADSDKPFAAGGGTSRRFMSINWGVHSGLPISGSVRHSVVYHRDAVGGAAGAEVSSDMGWVTEKQSWLLVGYLSQGAVIIDNDGVYRLDHTES